jgi:BirA family biotin operon repressor/biotin-[acetyl-CoA-carboxylase] ligase
MKTDIIRFETLDSTNTEAARWAMQGAAEGLCIVADEQTAGRGRLDRQWVSPKGAGLYVSIVLRPSLPQQRLPLLTLMASLAVCDALREIAGIEGDIKWPNDVLVQERKICGILSEVIETTSGRAVIIGIGINLTNKDFPQTLVGRAIAVEAITGIIPQPEKLLQVLLKTFSNRYEVLQGENGEAATVEAWSRLSSFANDKRVVVVVDGQIVTEGLSVGLERDGALRLRTNDGTIRTIRVGDVVAVRSSLNATNPPRTNER